MTHYTHVRGTYRTEIADRLALMDLQELCDYDCWISIGDPNERETRIKNQAFEKLNEWNINFSEKAEHDPGVKVQTSL